MNNNNLYATPKDRTDDILRIRVLSDGEMKQISEKPDNEYNDSVPTFSENGTECSFPSLAMVYSPAQEFDGLLEPEAALSCGSLFSDLYLPFEAVCCGRGNMNRNMGGR